MRFRSKWSPKVLTLTGMSFRGLYLSLEWSKTAVTVLCVIPNSRPNRRWRCPFRCRGSRRESAVAQLFTLGIIPMFGFRSFKDNKMWRRVLSVVFGCAFVVWGLVSICQGQITAFKHPSHTFDTTSEPFSFWIVVVLVLYLGVGCIYRGIKGKRDDT
jgi:hypothetical protein